MLWCQPSTQVCKVACSCEPSILSHASDAPSMTMIKLGDGYLS